ncbi:hypothetical protein RFI_19874 [Reticulomyxa filosa]|uniref:Uncharacterized protein n=1 Tax=Reticulomyxa filosa TaxID=46433 RepID=X6MU06_RETFI|nr:hypothetical protein RFI_19874 [Reticulomyxa filosa]|eukprot:ETO17448.1 hypothetical protein RFI_19874 [Reticulomyxa filosa]
MNMSMAVLTKNALFYGLHQGNLNNFFIDLICFKPANRSMQLQPAKKKKKKKKKTQEKLLTTFREWRLMEHLMEVASSNRNEDEIAVKYIIFFIDLVARSASVEEAGLLFHGHEELIVDSLMKGLLDEDQSRTSWQRVACGQTLVQYLDVCSRPTIVDPTQAYTEALGVPVDPSPNVLHQMFKVCAKLNLFIIVIIHL